MTKDKVISELIKQYKEICESFGNDLTDQEREEIKEEILGVNYHLELNEILKGI